jgi:predicted metalloprotease with PDZ domain
MHTVMGARSGADGDWVAEGLAELYSLELLVRSRTVSRRRHARALSRMEDKSRGVGGLATKDSSGVLTMRAVIVLHQLGEEIEAATDGESNLDELLRRLCAERGVISSERFRQLAEEVAGKPLPLFTRSEFRKVVRSSRARSSLPTP